MENRKHTILVALCLLLGLSGAAFSQTNKINLLGDFGDDWRQDWVERKLAVTAAVFDVVTEEDSNKVLRAMTEDAAGSMWRMLAIRPGQVGKIRWRWKIDGALSKNTEEMTKRGDDYVARVYIVFESHLVSWKTRALCYVWAAGQPVGSTYKNPYASTVRMIVVESGDENKRKWVAEERNFIADYRKAFNDAPEMITGVAVMVDSDNSNQFAMSYFDDLSIEVSDPMEEAKRRSREIRF